METLFDLSNPRVLKGVQSHIEKLTRRTPTSIEALHYLKIGADYICLDLGVTSASEDALDEAVNLKLASLRPLDVLPAAPLDLWDKSLTGRLIHQRKFHSDFTRHYWLIVSLCEAL